MPMTVLQREQILNTLRLGKGRQSTPYRNAACETGIRLLETSKKRPLDATETASVAACIRGLKCTLDGSKPPPLTMPRRDDRTPERIALDTAIRDAWAADMPPSWSIQSSDTWRQIVDTTNEILPDSPIVPRPGVAISMDHTRPPVNGVSAPIVWQNGTKRSTLTKFMDAFRHSGKAEF